MDGKDPDAYLTGFLENAKAYLTSTSMPRNTRADLDDELAELKKNFVQSKDDVERRELIHTLAEGLTKLGAGLAGERTHTDMSGVAIAPHDFQKDLANLLEEQKTNLADIRSRREEAQKDEQFQTEVGLKKAGLGLEAAKYASDAGFKKAEILQRNNQQKIDLYRAKLEETHYANEADYQHMMGEYHIGMLGILKTEKGEERDRKVEALFDGAKKDASSKIEATYKDPGAWKKNPEGAAAGILQGIAGIPGVTPQDIDKAKEALFEKGMLYGTNAKGPEESAGPIANIIQGIKPAKNVPYVRNPQTGKIYPAMNSDALKKYINAGYEQVSK